MMSVSTLCVGGGGVNALVGVHIFDTHRARCNGFRKRPSSPYSGVTLLVQVIFHHFAAGYGVEPPRRVYAARMSFAELFVDESDPDHPVLVSIGHGGVERWTIQEDGSTLREFITEPEQLATVLAEIEEFQEQLASESPE